MIALFTDFGTSGPYLGQVKAVLARLAPQVPVIDLLTSAPRFHARPSAYLLAALAPEFPAGTVFLCVIDPGVGGERSAVVLKVNGQHFVGPHNGLMNVVAKRNPGASWQEITWRPDTLSATFHGRDLFAPVAARLALGEPVATAPLELPSAELATWPDDLAEIIYIDEYGNAMTGMRAYRLDHSASLKVGDRVFPPARTYSAVAPGDALWYCNSNGLAEVALNQASAATVCGLSIGDLVRVL